MAREANVAAHVLAKWSLSNNYLGSFDVGLGPPCFVSVIRAEALSASVVCSLFNKISGLSKKKNIYIYIYTPTKNTHETHVKPISIL